MAVFHSSLLTPEALWVMELPLSSHQYKIWCWRDWGKWPCHSWRLKPVLDEFGSVRIYPYYIIWAHVDVWPEGFLFSMHAFLWFWRWCCVFAFVGVGGGAHDNSVPHTGEFSFFGTCPPHLPCSEPFGTSAGINHANFCWKIQCICGFLSILDAQYLAPFKLHRYFLWLLVAQWWLWRWKGTEGRAPD